MMFDSLYDDPKKVIFPQTHHGAPLCAVHGCIPNSLVLLFKKKSVYISITFVHKTLAN